MIGAIIVLLILVASLGWMVSDLHKKIAKQYKYAVSFKKIYKKANIPVMKLKLGDKFYNFILDSGSQQNILDKSFVDTLPENITAHIQEGNKVIGLSGEGQKSHSLKLGLSFGPSTFPDTLFSIMDIRAVLGVLENKTKEPIVGLLGAPFFEEYRWQIDFEELVVWLSK